MKLFAYWIGVSVVSSLFAAEPGLPAAPGLDRVGFPNEYQTKFQVVRTVVKSKENKLVTVYGNAPASSISNATQLPYPNGSIIVMETAKALPDADGKGGMHKDAVTGLHVMRKEIAFGEAYRTNRCGEWEFVEYRPDGSYLTPPIRSSACAECHVKAGAPKDYVYQGRLGSTVAASSSVAVVSVKPAEVTDSSPMHEKAAYLQHDLLDKHWLDGLYVSIVPSTPKGTAVPHTVNQPGNVIHAGVWTGRYLAGVGYQYAATQDPWVREHGAQILRALRIQQEVTGKPGLLARGYVKGHGPVEEWERNGQDSPEWHQGQGKYADYRWHGDVSVDNFNAVLYGYAIYFDLAADSDQRQFIAKDVDRLMTHLLDNHCRIIDVDGEVTLWGHVGIDPDPAFEDYYRKLYATRFSRAMAADGSWQPSLRASLMLLPDLLIAYHVTGQVRYLDFYHRVVERFKNNPDRQRDSGPFSLERLARVNHSSEGQAYEALYNLVRYEKDPELLAIYRKWVEDLWEMNWMEGNSLFAWMTRALLPEYRAPSQPGLPATAPDEIAHGQEAARLALDTLRLYPVDRVLRPVMNSLRPDLERNPFARKEALSVHPIPINERPLDNEYAWKGNPYQLDGWLKPTVTMFQASCDDPMVMWFTDSAGKLFMTLDGGAAWLDMTGGLRGARVQNITASGLRTFILHAQTDQGLFVTRDGGMSWRPAADDPAIRFQSPDFKSWQRVSENLHCRIGEDGKLMISHDQGQTGVPSMKGWRIPRAASVFVTARGILASGPGGSYQSGYGENWVELKLWPESETGAADFLHAYWMGRYYGYVRSDE